MRRIRTLIASMLAVSTSIGLASCTTGQKGAVTLGYLPSWSEGLVSASLLSAELEESGYSVETEVYGDPEGLYSALASGEIDIYPSAWPERTHAFFVEKHAGEIESVGAFYDGAENFLAVPASSSIESIPQLNDHADEFDHRIVGVEPGAGINAAATQAVETYGLEGFTVEENSTAHMLSALQTAIDRDGEVVVTMWTPFWPNTSMDLKKLEDPENVFGAPESLHFMANSSFNDAHPEVGQWLEKISLDQNAYRDLENLILNEYPEGQENRAVREWTRTYPDVVPDLGE